jgi:hypothetical protein
MPVSKKRKKAGKPVHRTEPVKIEGVEHAHGPEGAPVAGPPPLKVGKPTNPFTAQRTMVQRAQRGR